MTALRFVSSVWKSFQGLSGMEPRLLNNLRLVKAEPGVVHMELDVEQMHTNRLQILHGGVIAACTDLGGSLAVASRGLYSTGVSTDISVTYLSSGGKVGDKIFMEAQCEKLGKTLAFTKVIFRNGKDEMFARGSHTKYVAMAYNNEKNLLDQLKIKK